MALLTIPSITKGTVATVSLNKTDLFALAAVSADEYFSDSDNVKRCVIELNSDPGNQRKILDFDLSQTSPTASLLISTTGRDSFLLERLVLEDYDGGVIVLERSQLPSGLDVSIGGGGGGGGGGSSTITGLGTSLVWRAVAGGALFTVLTNSPPTPSNAVYTVNNFEYSVSNGIMNLSVHIEAPYGETIRDDTLGYVEVVLPGNYQHASAAFTSLGSGTARNFAGGDEPLIVKSWVNNGTHVLRFIGGPGSGFQDLWLDAYRFWFGNYRGGPNRWVFTATIPVVSG